jgi:hypothetical protein
MTGHRKWSTIKHKSQANTVSILAELDSIRAGESAFKIRVPFYNNPYTEPRLKNGWIRGYKRAERDFNDGLKRSAEIQATIGVEEVEA